MRGLLAWLAGAAVASTMAGAAQAEPGMVVGFSDDRPKWEGTRVTAPARSLGAGAFRLVVRWDGTQTQPTATQTAELDQALAASGGLRTVFAFAGTAATTPLSDAARDAYCTFARNVLARYQSVRDAVIWGEPNKSMFWQPQFNPDGTSAAPAAYAALAARCWDVLHEADPQVNVLGPALATNGNDVPSAASNVSHSPGNFIRKMGEAYRGSGRARPLFDTIAHHAYGASPGERPWRQHIGSKIIAQGDWNKLMYNLWQAFDGTAQPIPGACGAVRCTTIWYTESGYETRPDDVKSGLYTGTESVAGTLVDAVGGEPESPPPAETTTAPDQATQILDAVRLAYCQPYVGAFFNFLVYDEARLEGWQSGAYWADLTPKDSLPSFEQVFTAVNGRTVDCAALKGGPPSGDYFPPAAPAAPTAAVLRDPLRVDVAWSAPPDNVGATSYRVYRNGAQVATTNATAWTDTRPLEAATYTYTVRALDDAGNMGDASPGATVTTPDLTAPTVPTGVVARSATAPTRVELTWAVSTDKVGVAGYHVYRNGVYVGSTGSTSFVDANVLDAATYSYSVSAYDAAENVSAASPAVTVTTAPAAPSALSGTASTSGDGRISLDWADVAGASGYRVYRATAAGGPYENRTASPLVSSESIDVGTNGMTYYYVVTAVGPGGESAYSAEIVLRPTGELTKEYAPSRYTIASGSVYSARGEVTRISTDDALWLELASAKWGYTYTTDFTSVATIAEPPESLKTLQISYDGNVSTTDAFVTLMVRNQAGSWTTLDGPRAATTTDRSFSWSTTVPTGYISSAREVWFRVRVSATKAPFVSRTDIVRVTVTY